MGLKSLSKTVASAGTAERLSASDLLAWSAVIRARPGNTGNAYVGDATVSSTDPGIAPGDAVDLRGGPYINLFDIFVDVDADGEGVDVWYLEYT